MKHFKIKNEPIICMLLCMFAAHSQAQYFSTPTVTEIAAGASVICTSSTGNDILDVGSDTYRVSCWDQSTSGNSGFEYDVTVSSVNYVARITFASSGTYTPDDICLVQRSGRIYVVAVYYVSGTGYYWEVYGWGGTAFSLVSSSVFETSTFLNNLHIDADDTGDFIAVWDNPNGRIYAITGNPTGLYNSGTPVAIQSGTFPDVAVYSDGLHGHGVHVVHISDISGGNVRVHDYTYGSISSGSPSGSLMHSSSPGINSYYDYPRIACPNSSGASTDWTVVFTHVFPASIKWRVEAFNKNAGTVGSQINYNDGIAYDPFWDILNATSVYPVVTYDDNSPVNIWICWTFDNSAGYHLSGGEVKAIYPIGLKCDNTAIPLSGQLYNPVPITVITSDVMTFPAISGRYGSATIYLTFNGQIVNGSTVDDIYNKGVSTAATTFRMAEDVAPGLNTMKDLDPSHIYSLTVFDMQGALVYSATDNYSNLLQNIKTGNIHLPPAIYLARVNNMEGKVVASEKLFVDR